MVLIEGYKLAVADATRCCPKPDKKYINFDRFFFWPEV